MLFNDAFELVAAQLWLSEIEEGATAEPRLGAAGDLEEAKEAPPISGVDQSVITTIAPTINAARAAAVNSVLLDPRSGFVDANRGIDRLYARAP